MGKDDLYKSRRWTDIPKATVIGHFEQTEEERKENKRKLRAHLKKIGVITEEEEQELNKDLED